MKFNQIPGTDLNVSAIALGTWVFSGDVWQGAEERTCLDAVQTALDVGINLIDTAPIYGYGISESIIAKALKGKREKVIIATKCGLIGQGANIRNNLSPESIFSEIDASLSRLNTDYIDIYQCHWPDPDTPIERTMEALRKLQDRKKIRYIGVSNFDLPLLERALATAKIVTVQNQFSLVEHKNLAELAPFCQEQSVGLLAYGPLAGGILSGKYKEPPQFKGPDARKFFYQHYSGHKFQAVKTLLTGLEKLERPLHQVAINWVRRQSGISSVLCGCRNPEQVLSNASSTDWDLSAEELTYINSLING